VTLPPPATTRHSAWLGPLAAALVAGCATPSANNAAKLPPYAAPPGASTAKLAVRGAVPSGDYFGVLVYDDADNCKSPRLAGAGSSTRNPESVALAAGGLQTLAFVIVKPNKQSCSVRWSFTPQSNKTYVINGGALGSGCTASLLDASNPDRMRVPDGLVRRTAPGVFCVPLAQAPAVKGNGTRGGQSDGAAVLNPGATADDLQGLIGK
jgi:hypothetical protein